jgi:hypothetical protein
MSSTPDSKSDPKLDPKSDLKSALKADSKTNGSSREHGDGNSKESLLYNEFLAEREEILRHKWIESEKAGHDIGFEKALLDWVVRFRASWRQQRKDGVPFSKAG